MNKKEIKTLLLGLYSAAAGNCLPEGGKIYDSPVIGFGSAADGLFARFKAPEVIGPWHMSPEEWLPGAKTVISLFFPFSEEVKSLHRKARDQIPFPWLYARVEGQELLDELMDRAAAVFADKGIAAVVPATDPRFKAVQGGKGGIQGYEALNENSFGSTWSERHAAYVCGLGTFGLSRGLITEKGIAGRFASIIIGLELEPDPRHYSGIYDYCTKCGACIRRCPVSAIDADKGKDHRICGPYVDQSKRIYAPRYGCGLCQTGVPCESGIPKKQ